MQFWTHCLTSPGQSLIRGICIGLKWSCCLLKPHGKAQPGKHWLNTPPVVVLGLNLAQGLENLDQCMDDSRPPKNVEFQPGFVSGMDKDPSVWIVPLKGSPPRAGLFGLSCLNPSSGSESREKCPTTELKSCLFLAVKRKGLTLPSWGLSTDVW